LTTTRPPNLLFILTDEQRCDTLEAYGNSRIECPNLNRLARESTVFERAYITQPVCTPSRGSIMTGLHPHQHGCVDNNALLDPRHAIWAERLPGHFATGYNGKWHLGDEVFPQRGFAEWVSTEDGYSPWFSQGRDRETKSSYYHFLAGHGFTPRGGIIFSRAEAARMEEPFSKPAFQAGQACDFIRRHRAEPFALCVSFLEPHMPFFGPRDAQHPPEEVHLPGNFDHVPDASQSRRARINRAATFARGFSGYPLQSERDWREMIARYWGLCSLVDTAVGRILASLEECGIDDNTIVVFTSDHGDMMGSHRMIAKCLMFEESIRVPLMIRLPGQRSGSRVARPVSSVDLAPTVLDLLGAKPTAPLPGRSLRPELEGQPVPEPTPVVVEWNGGNTSPLKGKDWEEYPAWAAEVGDPAGVRASLTDPVRTWIDPDGWKLTRSTIGEDELYHLPSDPGETSNRLADPAARADFQRLDARLRQWQEQENDPVRFP